MRRRTAQAQAQAPQASSTSLPHPPVRANDSLAPNEAGEAEGEGMATGDADNGVGAAHSAERAAAEAAVRLLVGDSPLSFLSFPHSDPVVLTCALCFPRPVTVGARCPAWSGSSLG